MTDASSLVCDEVVGIETAAETAVRQIPPLWPLDASVAVNPFLGQTGESLAEAGARLARVGGIPVTMPRRWYRERIAAGRITDADLEAALAAAPAAARPVDLRALKQAAATDRPAPEALPTLADLAARADGTDWPGLIADRFGVWASGYFDRGQALWAAPRGKSAWAAFRAHASNDLTPEILGLTGFAAFVADMPEDPVQAIAEAVARLGIEEGTRVSYFHQLLLTLGGWAQAARYLLWRAELAGETDRTAIDFLAIRLTWEAALFRRTEDRIAERWAVIRAAHAAPIAPGPDEVVDAILQEAAERAAQRDLSKRLEAPGPIGDAGRPAVQAAFCIDVRSEVFRRALEAVDPAIRTIGFAGFFGVAAEHRRFASDVAERRLPVLLNPAVGSCAGGPEDAAADRAARYAARAKRAWGRFKYAAVSSFAFVEAMGPVYVGKLVRDALGRASDRAAEEPPPRFDPALSLDQRIDAAEAVLRAMSLTAGFARLVLLAGHGANTVNNPFASALNCGACGGYSGAVNARLLAGLLNEEAVRAGLAERGIDIPADTLFVAGLHDTTTDAVTLFDRVRAAPDHSGDLAQLRRWLEAAGRRARGERALALPRASGGDVARRARDWAEVRPEWGLAGNQAFIAAPRGRTAGRSLEGQAFLHDYDWRQDETRGFAVLELILTAPVVVASWISLQYYGSSVAPDAFGSGNKLLHNVVGGFGVVEGNGGLLRAGLPRQSVHDGERLVHAPLRLAVCVEAPTEAMNAILERHSQVRALFDNRWLHLFAMDGEGRLAHRYAGDLRWEEERPAVRRAAA